MKSIRSKSQHSYYHLPSVSTTAVLKLITFYIVLFSLGIVLIFCSYKIYMDTWLEDFRAKNFLFEEILQGIPQTDHRILSHLKRTLHGPSQLPYNWSRTMSSGYNGVNTKVRKVLGAKQNGFFVETTAGDGEYNSNTRVLEVNHGWVGLLIEPNPLDFQALLLKQRKVFALNSCVSPYPYPWTQEFTSPVNYSISEPQRSKLWKFHRINCFPLYSILAAVGRNEIDYLSLHSDGTELDILKTIPFNALHIKAISVRYTLIPEGGDVLKDFLVSKGYVLISEAETQFIFVLKALTARKYTVISKERSEGAEQDENFTEYYDDNGEITILGDASFEGDSKGVEIQVNDEDYL